ncbi:MAG: zinc-ribbon domain-containing protein [Clostridiales bacterium]|nr:zinc-ribbon domain-containing protein [Clostridiales bacterium]
MKNCPNCNTQLNDDAVFCTNCGKQLAQAQYAPQPDPYDHTAEFDEKDISENKVISMLVYLMGWIGIILALLGSNTSKYAAFHVRQALKFVVVETLIPIVLAVGVVVNIIPFLGTIIYGLAFIVAMVLYIIFFVVKIICFFQICKGQAKEPAIIKKLDFLR